MLPQTDIDRLAGVLHAARLERRELAPLVQSTPFDLEDGYRIQRAGLELRQAAGERLVGLKMGFTSEAKRKQMNLGDPIFGFLTDAMRIEGTLPLGEGVHPKAEPEIAFVMARELRGEVTLEQAWSAVGEVCAAVEILDSRFAGFKYFSLPDVVADDCSAFKFALGARVPASSVSLERLAALPMQLLLDGAVRQQAPASAISGHPVRSLVQLCALLKGEPLPAGSIVLAGAATAAEALAPGTRVEVRVEGLPPVSFQAT